MYKLVLIILVFMFATFYSQTMNDSLVTKFNYPETINFQKLNSLKTDWNITNYPLLFYQITPSSSTLSLNSLYTESYLNSGSNFSLTPDIMLNQFQLVNNWSTKKKYGVFAKYLGIAQFVGVIGLAAVHISKYHMPKKTENNLKTNNLIEPKK